MTEPKKISFGFSKLSKKTNIFAKPLAQEKKVELIDCLEGQSIKIKDVVEIVEGPLIIPVQGNDKNLLDRVKEANELKDRSRKKYEAPTETESDDRSDSELTLDELAARQLIREAKNFGVKKNPVKIYSLPAIEDKLILEGSVESTIHDYENVPISEYGLAMLRGMGWKDGGGLGKGDKVSPVAAPELRPKGMGLGANKMVSGQKHQKPATDKEGNELTLNKGVHAKVIAGKEQGNYCIVQGLDDEAGRVIVKMTLKGEVLSLNEFLLMPVTPEEYGKCSKILNNAKYEQFKEKSNQQENGKIKLENPSKSIQNKIKDEPRGSQEQLLDLKKEESVAKSSGENSDRHRSRSPEPVNSKHNRNRSPEQDNSKHCRNRSHERDAYRSSEPDNLKHNRNRSPERDAYNRNRTLDKGSNSKYGYNRSPDNTKKGKSTESKFDRAVGYSIQRKQPRSRSRSESDDDDSKRRELSSDSDRSREACRRDKKKRQRKPKSRSRSRSRKRKSHKSKEKKVHGSSDSEEKRGKSKKEKKHKKKSKHRSRSSTSDSDSRRKAGGTSRGRNRDSSGGSDAGSDYEKGKYKRNK